jgi:hypothetical protein
MRRATRVKRGAVHETERLVRTGTGYESDKLLPGGPMERLHLAIAKGYERQKDPDYACVSWASQEAAHAFCEAADWDVVRIMAEVKRVDPTYFTRKADE